ncbi:MAG: hypothetical protein ACK56F_29220, partial [bacterium]
NQRAVYQHLVSMKLDGFQPMNDRPVTDVHKAMAQESKGMGDAFLEAKFPDLVTIAMGGMDGDIKMVSEGKMRVASSVMTSYLLNFFHEDLKIADINSNNKASRIGSVKLRESSSRIEKYSRLQCQPMYLG